jgi:formylmethanofuran dehydrogenase subunit E
VKIPQQRAPSRDAAPGPTGPGAAPRNRPERSGDACWCRDHRGRRYTFGEALDYIRAFHGHVAPGLVIGLKMVDRARALLPGETLCDAVCETASCLPDAVQMLTPCTVGNTWLKIHDLGKFALTLYDKATGRGRRVFLDPAKLAQWPEFYDWFCKRKPKSAQDFGRLLEDIRQAGAEALSDAAVDILPPFRRATGKGPIGICPLCGEAFPRRQGGICRGCRGEAPYARPATP